MAKFSGNFWRGVAGPVIFKEHRGQQIVTSASTLTKDQMTVASLKSANTFGAASSLNRYIRSAFDFKSDGDVSGRLNGAVNSCLDRIKNKKLDIYEFETGSFNSLAGFEFNLITPFKKHFLAQPKVTVAGLNLQVEMPEIKTDKEIKFHPDAHQAKLAICLGMFDIINGQYDDVLVQSFDTPIKGDMEVIPAASFDFELSPGCLCIVAFSLIYMETTFVGQSFLNNKNFSPSAIFTAFIAEGEPLKKEEWHDMNIRFITEVPAEETEQS
ncbi:hypothetical protein ACVWYN_002553 [Pedobacter sp. UYP24]